MISQNPFLAILTSKNALSCLALATAEEVNELFIKELLHYSLALIKKADPREKSICVITGELKPYPTSFLFPFFERYACVIKTQGVKKDEKHLGEQKYDLIWKQFSSPYCQGRRIIKISSKF